MQAVSGVGVTQNGAHGVIKAANREIRRLTQALSIPAINKDRSTSCRARAIDISPPISDYVTGVKINIQLGCCSENHARPRLATIARLAVTLASMKTDLDAIDPWKRRSQFCVHRLDVFATLSASADVGLVRDNDQKKSRCLQSRATVCSIFVQFKIVEARGRIRATVADDGPVNNSIAIQEDSAPRYF